MNQALKNVQSLEDHGEKAVQKPLNSRQVAFARELGIARAEGKRDFTAEYAKVGFKPNRGNAARLASDPRVKAIADLMSQQALEASGLHVAYLQAKAIQLLDQSIGGVFLSIRDYMEEEIVEQEDKEPAVIYRLKHNLSAAERADFEAKTWGLSDFKIDDKGVITIKVPDKKGIIEMLAKQLGVGLESRSGTNVNVEGNCVMQVVTGVPRAPNDPPLDAVGH